RQVDAATTLTIQLLSFDELHDLAPCRLLDMPQQADVVKRACPRRWQSTAGQFNEHERVGKRLIGGDQINESFAASAEMVYPHRRVDQYVVHSLSALGRRRGMSDISGTVPPSAARRL